MSNKEGPVATPEDFLDRAANLLGLRGQQYDSPKGERSMFATVLAFNAITGHCMTESEGWLLLLLLKQVRQWKTPNKYHEDSAQDAVAYAALLGASLYEESLQQNAQSWAKP